MPETPPSTPAPAPAADCHRGHGPATRIVEWHEPDVHSACGETYGPFHLLVCADDACLTAAIDHALDEGGERIDHYFADETAGVLPTGVA